MKIQFYVSAYWSNLLYLFYLFILNLKCVLAEWVSIGGFYDISALRVFFLGGGVHIEICFTYIYAYW